MTIKTIPQDQWPLFVDMADRAYPGLNMYSAEARQGRLQRMTDNKENTERLLHGCYRDDKLVGGMMFFDFTANFFGQPVEVGGVGQVCVDLLHKKEGIAKELITFFLTHYRDRGFPVTALYPFRPDFYKKMGYGWGTKNNRYVIRPAALPKGPSKANVRFLTPDDAAAVTACHNRYVEQTHGMFRISDDFMPAQFKAEHLRWVGVEQDGELRGYMSFVFEGLSENNIMLNNINVELLAYETPEALSEILTFLHGQADQIQNVVFNTQDENLHFLLDDPRNGSDRLIPFISHESNSAGIGLMYRVTDVAMLFGALKEHDFNGQTVRMKLNIEDTFLADFARETVVHFEGGRATVAVNGEHDVEVFLNLADFSSLVLGSVDFRTLHRLGRAKLSDASCLQTVHNTFRSDSKPICINRF